MARITTYVVLCEDKCQYTFARRFLIGRGAHPRRFTARICPTGRGSGEQWVREQLPSEVQAIRRYGGPGKALIVITDADNLSTAQRATTLDRALATADVPAISEDERIGVFVAKRNIETWILHVLDPGRTDVDEQTDYSARPIPDGWQRAVQDYAARRLPKAPHAPESFRLAETEYAADPTLSVVRSHNLAAGRHACSQRP